MFSNLHPSSLPAPRRCPRRAPPSGRAAPASLIPSCRSTSSTPPSSRSASKTGVDGQIRSGLGEVDSGHGRPNQSCLQTCFCSSPIFFRERFLFMYHGQRLILPMDDQIRVLFLPVTFFSFCFGLDPIFFSGLNEYVTDPNSCILIRHRC